MPRTRENTAYAQRLIREYNHARKILHKYLKKRHDPSDVTAMIAAIIENMTAKQSKIIGYTLNKSFKAGAKEGDKILRSITASTATMGFDMSKVADTHLNKITGDTIGRIGKYNSVTTNQLFGQYQTLLADNKLVNTLNKSGWSQSIEKSLIKRGTSAEVISQLKGQTTTKKIVTLLETQGIRGGMNPREVSRLLQPHVSSYFGPKGVIIDNVGKFKKVLKVDADGNFKYVKQAITRPYRATPKAYSNLLARSSMIQAHHEGRYQSLQKTGLVDHYISKSVLDANTCNLCATMHGQRVSHSGGPLYHPSGACELKPIWKKDSGISNKDPAFYENQRDQHFWKQHQLAEYNKNMPRGAKLKFHSMLPKDAIATMPGKGAMRTIRYDALGEPAAIKPSVVKPKAVEKIVKPKEAKKAQLEKLKREEREKANELWKKTDKDGFEHLKTSNSKTKLWTSNSKQHVDYQQPKTPFTAHHTHPNWDSPLSGGDIGNFLQNRQHNQQAASSSKRVYIARRTGGTKVPKEGGKFIEKKFNKLVAETNKQRTLEFKTQTGWSPTKSQAQKILHGAADDTNKLFAKEYNYEYISFTRK